jgi:DNA adenine methylase
LPVLSGNRYASHYTPIPPIPVKPTSRTFDLGALKSYAREWAGVPMAIAATADRLRAVTIDPPYPMSTRSAGGKGYVHEMSDQDHRNLAWMLHSCAAKVLISGYPCSFYDELYHDWRCERKHTTANGQSGAVSRTELLWMNYQP